MVLFYIFEIVAAYLIFSFKSFKELLKFVQIIFSQYCINKKNLEQYVVFYNL